MSLDQLVARHDHEQTYGIAADWLHESWRSMMGQDSGDPPPAAVNVAPYLRAGLWLLCNNTWSPYNGARFSATRWRPGADVGGDDRGHRRHEGVAEVTPFDWFLRLHTPAGRATHLGLGDRRVHASKRREGPRLFTRRALTAGASMSARLVSAWRHAGLRETARYGTKTCWLHWIIIFWSCLAACPIASGF